MATATTTKPTRAPKKRPAKKPAPAARLSKTELTVAEAADQWEAADRDAERAAALKKEAGPVLLAHFEKTGRLSYKDRIALRQGADRTVLDTDAVKSFLGERLPEFQTRVTPKPSLTRMRK
jgi:hypothetical protein